MESYHKRKKLLEEKCGKLIDLKPYFADNKQQKYVKQLQKVIFLQLTNNKSMLNNFKIYLMRKG